MDHASATASVRLQAKLPRLTVEQLKILLRQLGCRVSGRKQVLIDRVVEKALTSEACYLLVNRHVENATRLRANRRPVAPFGSATLWAQFLVNQINQRRQQQQHGAPPSFAVGLMRPAASMKPPSAAHITITPSASVAPSARREFQQLCADSDPFAAIVYRDLGFFSMPITAGRSTPLASRFVVPPVVQDLVSKEQMEVTFEAYEMLCGGGGAAAAPAPAPLAAQRRHAGTLRCAAPSAARAGRAVRVGRWSCCGAPATVASCRAPSLASPLTVGGSSAAASAAASAAPPALYTSTSGARVKVYGLSRCIGRDIVARQWPSGARITVNGVHVFAQPMESAAQAGNGACIDITTHLKPSGEANVLQFTASGVDPSLRLQALLVRVVAPLSVETLARRIGASQTQATEGAKARMRCVLFAPPPGARSGGGGGAEEDGLEECVYILKFRDYIFRANPSHTLTCPHTNVCCSLTRDRMVATCTRLSLRCPLSLAVLGIPARGAACHHIQAFDLSTFLLFNRNKSKQRWQCPVCDGKVAPNAIVVDGYQAEILRSVGAGSAAAAAAAASGADEVDAVRVLAPNADWEIAPPVSRSSGSSSRRRKREAAQAESAAAAKRARLSAAAGVGADVSSAALAAATLSGIPRAQGGVDPPAPPAAPGRGPPSWPRHSGTSVADAIEIL